MKKFNLGGENSAQSGAETFGKSFIKKCRLDNRGQSGAVFRLMVDGIIGLVILIMIISVLTYFQSLEVSASNEKFLSLVQSASGAPIGKVFVEKDLVFVPGGFSAIGLRNLTNLHEDCFSFESNLSSVNVSHPQKVDFTSNIRADVYARCVSCGNACQSGNCDIECIVSFGKKLENIE